MPTISAMHLLGFLVVDVLLAALFPHFFGNLTGQVRRPHQTCQGLITFKSNKKLCGESFTVQAQKIHQATTTAHLCVLPVVPWKRTWSCPPVTGQPVSSPLAWLHTRRRCRSGRAHAVPTEGWEMTRSWQVPITNLAPGPGRQDSAREMFALSFASLVCSFPVSFQHWKLLTPEETRSWSPLQHGTGNATAQ